MLKFWNLWLSLCWEQPSGLGTALFGPTVYFFISASSLVTAFATVAYQNATGVDILAIIFEAFEASLHTVSDLWLIKEVLTFTMKFRFWMHQTFPRFTNQAADLLVALASVCALSGEHGFDLFLQALIQAYAGVSDWMMHVKGEIEGLKDRMEKIEKIVKDSGDKKGQIRIELQKLEADAWLLVTLVSVINKSDDLGLVEEKKKEAREIGTKLKAAISGMMENASSPLGLDMPPILDFAPILQSLPDAASLELN